MFVRDLMSVADISGVTLSYEVIGEGPRAAVIRPGGRNRPDPTRLARIARAVAESDLVVAQPRIMRLSETACAYEMIGCGGAGKIVLVPDRLFEAAQAA